MGADLPLFAAVVARLPDPEVHLAAFGSLVFPISLLIEAPIIMLLAASTALSTDRVAYAKLRRFTHVTGFGLSALHALVAFTPLFDYVAGPLMGVPAEVIEPARLGLKLMTPWSWAIASRRFQQGVLIRCGHSRAVGVGTMARLATNALVLALGFSSAALPGIAVGCSAIAAGVTAEALFIGWRVRPVLASDLPSVPPQGVAALDRRRFARFYTPLALTPFLTLAAQPLGAAAMARMPAALSSLAAWPAVHGLIFLTRSLGIAYNEVVVALLAKPGASAALQRFQKRLMLGATAILLALALTPLSSLWFEVLSGLPPELAELSRAALVFALALPACSVLHSWYQGVLLHVSHSRPITEAVGVSLLVTSLVLAAGTYMESVTGIFACLAALSAGAIAQAAWLARRTRGRLADRG